MRALLAALLVSLGTQLVLSARQYDEGEMMVPQQGMLGPSWGGWGGLSMFGGQQFDPREAEEAELNQARFMGSSSGDEGEDGEAAEEQAEAAAEEEEEEEEAGKPEGETTPEDQPEDKPEGEDNGEAKTGAALRTHMAELSKQSAELERRAAELKDKERKLDESLKRAAAAADGAKAAPNASVVTALTVALPTLTTPPIAVRTAEASDNATCPASRSRLTELLDTLRQGFTLSAEELERTEASIKEAQTKYNTTHQQVMSERAERDGEVTKAEVESVERIDADETEALHLIEAELAVAKSRAAGARSLLVKEREIKQADELADQSAHVRDAVAKIEEVLESRLAGLRAQRRSVADGLAAARAERDSALSKVQAHLQHAARTIRSKRTEISKLSQVATELLGASASIEAGLQKDLHVAADHFRHHDEPIKSSWSPSEAAKAAGLDDKAMTAGGPDHASRAFGSEPTGDELEEMRKAIREADIADDHVGAAHTIASEHRLAHDVDSVSTGMTVAEEAMEADKKEEATDAEAQEKLAAAAEKKAEEALAGAKEAMEQHEFRQTAARDADAAVMAATGKLSPSFLQAGAKAGSKHSYGPSYMPIAMSSLTPIGYSNPGFQAASQNALAVQRTVGAVTGAVPYPVPDTPTSATPMGLGPLSSGLTPTEYAAIHGIPTDSYYMPSDMQATPQASVYMRDVLAAASRLTGHGGLLSGGTASTSGASSGTAPSNGTQPGNTTAAAGQAQTQGQATASSTGQQHSFRQQHRREVDTTASSAPAEEAESSLESMVNDKAADDMLVKQEDEEEAAAASQAEAQLDEASASLDAELGKAKGTAAVDPHSNLMDADAIRLIKGGKAAARVAARVAQRYANTRDIVHTHFETVGHGLGPWTGGKQTADQVLAGEPSFRQRSGHSGKEGGGEDMAGKPLNELPFKTIGEAVKTAETLVEGIHKRLQGVDKVRAELQSHLTDLQVQRQEAAKKLKSLQEVDRLAEQTAASESEHAATLSDMDKKIFGLGSDGRADDGMYVCDDGTKRADALSCPSGGTIKWTNLKESRDADGKVQCSDGTSRFDGSNCPGGSLLAGPAAEDDEPKDNLADAKAKARAEAERKARRAKMESLQKQIDELDAAIVRLRRLDTEAQAAAEKLRSREKHVGEATDSLVAAAEQRSMLTDQQTQEREKLLALIRESEDIRRIETELAEEARRKYETHVRTVMRSLKAVELAEADAMLASQRARALANETVSTKGRARLRELHAELNKKDAAISQELKAAVEASHTEREEASEQRRLAEKTARTRADLLRSRHRVTAAEDVVEAARMRAAGIKAVVVEERKMAARQKDVRERAIKASEATFASHHASRANSTSATHSRARVLLASARRLRRLNAAGKSATRLLRAYLQDASRAENQVLSLAAQGVAGAPADEPPQEEGPTATELVDKLSHSVSSAMASESSVRHTIKPNTADAASAVADANAAAAAAANPDAASFLQLRSRLRGPMRSLLQVQARQEEEEEEVVADEAAATEDAGEPAAAVDGASDEEADPIAEADAEELQEQAAEEATEEAEAAEVEQAEASAEADAESEAAEDVLSAEMGSLSPEAKKALVNKELALEEAEAAAEKAAEEKAAEEAAAAAAADPAAAATATADAAADAAAAAVEAEKKKEDPAGIPEEAAHVDPNKDILDQPLPPLPRVTTPPAEEVPEDEPMAARVERLERQGKAFADGARRSARTARLLIERISAIRMAADEVTMRLPREELDYFTTRETSATNMAELCQAESEAFDKYSQTGLQKGAQLLEELASKAAAIEARMATVGATAKSDSEKQRAKAEAQAERGAKAEIELESGMAAAKHDAAEEAPAASVEAAQEAAPEAEAATTEAAGAAAEAAPAAEAATEAATEAGAEAPETPAAEEAAAAAAEAAEAPVAAEASAEAEAAPAAADAEAAAEPAAAPESESEAPAEEAGLAAEATGDEAAPATSGDEAAPAEAALLQSSAHVFGAVRQNRRRLRGGVRRQVEEAAVEPEAAGEEAATEPEEEAAAAESAEAAAEPEAAAGEEAAAEAGEAGEAAQGAEELSAEEQAAAVVDGMPSETDESAEEEPEQAAAAGVEQVDAEAQAEAETVAETDGSEPLAAAEAAHAAGAEAAAPAKEEKTAEADVLGFPAHERVLENAEDAVEAAEEELEMAKAEAARLSAEYMEHRKAALAVGAKLHETGPLPKPEEEEEGEEEEQEPEEATGSAEEVATEEAEEAMAA